MEMSITKTYAQSVTIEYQTWKYATTLSRTVSVASGKELAAENEKLFNQAKKLTELDMKRDEAARKAWLEQVAKTR